MNEMEDTAQVQAPSFLADLFYWFVWIVVRVDIRPDERRKDDA
jgi:hypothetical protein